MVVTEVNKAEPRGGESLKENEAHASSISLPVTDVFSQSRVVQIHFNDANHDAHCTVPSPSGCFHCKCWGKEPDLRAQRKGVSAHPRVPDVTSVQKQAEAASATTTKKAHLKI